LYRRLGGPQSRYGRCGGEKILSMPGIEPGSPARSPSLIIDKFKTEKYTCKFKAIIGENEIYQLSF
jgi:hypothetical protein